MVGQAKQCMEPGFCRWNAKGTHKRMSVEEGCAHAIMACRLALGVRGNRSWLSLTATR
jgi:hypothetical protein